MSGLHAPLPFSTLLSRLLIIHITKQAFWFLLCKNSFYNVPMYNIMGSKAVFIRQVATTNQTRQLFYAVNAQNSCMIGISVFSTFLFFIFLVFLFFLFEFVLCTMIMCEIKIIIIQHETCEDPCIETWVCKRLGSAIISLGNKYEIT